MSQNMDTLPHKYTLVEMCELAESRAVFRVCHFLLTLHALMKYPILPHRIKLTEGSASVTITNQSMKIGWVKVIGGQKLLMCYQSPLFVINYLYSLVIFGKVQEME
jgi:hypothetical protein